MDNCPYCGHEHKRSIGRSRSGHRRYQCLNCRMTWTSTEKIPDRPPRQRGPVHPGCSVPSRRHSLTPKGTRRWFCPECGKTWIQTPARRGRKPVGRNPAAVRAAHAKYRAKNPEKAKAWAKAAYERRKRRLAERQAEQPRDPGTQLG